MAATATWYEQNGTATGSPASGVESAVTGCDWKSVDDATTSRANAVVEAGGNSYTKYNYTRFAGSFNQISGVKFAHTTGTLGTGISLKSKITSTYETPTAGAMAGATDITSTTAIGSGASVLLGANPNSANPSASMTTACSTQYIVTQIQTTSNANSGDSGTAVLTIQWLEN